MFPESNLNGTIYQTLQSCTYITLSTGRYFSILGCCIERMKNKEKAVENLKISV